MNSSVESEPKLSPRPQQSFFSSDSDSSLDSSPLAKASHSPSPRKRRNKNQEHEEKQEAHPVDEDGYLDVDKLFSTDWDWEAAFTASLNRSLPGRNNIEWSGNHSWEQIKEEAKEKLNSGRGCEDGQDSTTEFQFDAETFELKAVHKKPKGQWEDKKEEQQTDEQQPGTSTEQDLSFKKPRLRNRKFLFKPFLRTPDGGLKHDDNSPVVDVVIPEQLAASYGLYIWPCSPVLSWYLWLHQDKLQQAKVLELGAGTALPGLLCAKLGAQKVWLSDDPHVPNVLDNCREAVKLNGLCQDRVEVIGLAWGDYDEQLFQFEDQLDYIIGSDLFFDPEVFEPLCATVSFLLEHNPRAKALISVQERSEDWTAEEFFLRWGLKAKVIHPQEFLSGTGIEETDLTGRHTIYLLEITFEP